MSNAKQTPNTESPAQTPKAEIMAKINTYRNLKRMDLSKLKLSGVNFRGKILAGANLSNADLRKANLSGANLSGANLFGARVNKSTIITLPSGYKIVNGIIIKDK